MAKPRAWLRLYTEFASDPKVQLLDETLQRRFVMLLCLAGAGITPTSDVSVIDYALRVGVSECERTREILVSKGLIDERWFPKAWGKRQFESDTSTERVKRFRKRCKVVTGNDSETPSEQSRAEQIRGARASRLPDDFSLTSERRAVAEAEGVNPERTFAGFCDYWRAESGAKARKHDWDATWRNWCRRQNDGKRQPTKTDPFKGAH